MSKFKKWPKNLKKAGHYLVFSQLALLSGGMVLIVSGIFSFLMAQIKNFVAIDGITLKTASTMHFFVGGVAIFEGLVGFTCISVNKLIFLHNVKNWYLFCATIFFLSASANAIIFQVMIDHKEYPRLNLNRRLSHQLGWRIIQPWFKCCGYNNYTDWMYKDMNQIFKEGNYIPIECCVVENLFGVVKDLDEKICMEEARRLLPIPKYIFPIGCKNYIKESIKAFGALSTILCFSISLVQLFSLTMLHRKILKALKRESTDYDETD